jgi:transposase
MQSHSPATMQYVYLGIDIAKATFAVALLAESGVLLATSEFSNNDSGFRHLCQWYTKQLKSVPHHHLHACMEATGRYGDELATYLYEHFAAHAIDGAHIVSIVNPHQTKSHARSRLQRNKTDKLDAENIAHFCATHHPDAWQPASEAQQRLKELTRHQESLEKSLTQEKLRLQSGLKDKTVQKQIKRHIRFLEEQLKDIEEEIASLCKQDETLHEATRLLVSIPGVGLTTAARFLAELPHLQHFHTAAQVVAYAGLSPQQTHSGSSVHRKGKLSKTGNRHLRTAVYMPTLAAMRWNPVIREFTNRLKNNGKSKMTAVAAGMRKLLQIMFGVLKSGRPFDPNYNPLQP